MTEFMRLIGLPNHGTMLSDQVSLYATQTPSIPPTILPSNEVRENESAPSNEMIYPPAKEPTIIPIIIIDFRDIVFMEKTYFHVFLPNSKLFRKNEFTVSLHPLIGKVNHHNSYMVLNRDIPLYRGGSVANLSYTLAFNNKIISVFFVVRCLYFPNGRCLSLSSLLIPDSPFQSFHPSLSRRSQRRRRIPLTPLLSSPAP